MPVASHSPVLCYVTDRHSLPLGEEVAAEQALVANAARAAAAGVDWIQIREKDLAGGALLQLVTEILRRSAPARIVVNDRLDIAVAAGAAGVHLGGQSLPVHRVARWRLERALSGFLVGVSCHSIEEALAGERDGADYILFGPVFHTPSKLAYGPPQGAERLAEVCRAVQIPVIAIGGVAPKNARSCVEAGARGLGAIRWFQEHRDLPGRVAELRAACR